MSELINKVIEAAGGEVWRRPKSLQLSGKAIFTPWGKLEEHLELDTYKMYRIFPQKNRAAHHANEKVCFEAAHGEQLFFLLKFDGLYSEMKMGETAQPYAQHFRWSNNFGFGIIRFADQKDFRMTELPSDQVEGHDCHLIQVKDPQAHETLFAIDKKHFFIRRVAFNTSIGYHHRIYSDFQKAPNGFLQPCHVRIYYDDIKWVDIQWDSYLVNEEVDDTIFLVKK